jgi:hypothetical protein
VSAKGGFTHRLRILLVESLVGLVLGVGFWELFGRRLLAMKYGSLGSSVTCAPDVVHALTDFDSGMRRSAVVGALGCMVVMFTFRIWRWRRRKKQATSANTPPAGAPRPVQEADR